MPYKVTESALNASTLDILNVIRENASVEYQNLVPVAETATDIPKVGDVLYGHPAMANQFINALLNRIAMVRVRSLMFNNPYKDLKKGYLRFGETVENVYVELAKPIEFSAEKGMARELKRWLPKVRSAFHIMNWRVIYPMTVQREDLRMAFTDEGGLRDFIDRIIQSTYTGNEYDEFLLTKYLLIKAYNAGAIKSIALTVPAGGDADKVAAMAFRATSNKLEFVSDQYNAAGVHTVTKRNDQYIFMDAEYNAQFDVNVLAAAFHMDKADFMGHLKLIDSFSTFDNERFEEIRANSTGLEEVTAAELAAMADIKAIIVDEEFFQIYDNLEVMTETPVNSGLYWNYFLHCWKTVSYSPFANAVAIGRSEVVTNITGTVEEIDIVNGYDSVTTVKLNVDDAQFVQTEALTEAGIAVTPNGVIIIPDGVTPPSPFTITIQRNGTTYTGTMSNTVGATITFTAQT